VRSVRLGLKETLPPPPAKIVTTASDIADAHRSATECLPSSAYSKVNT
jgi:hypothetical protein